MIVFQYFIDINVFITLGIGIEIEIEIEKDFRVEQNCVVRESRRTRQHTERETQRVTQQNDACVEQSREIPILQQNYTTFVFFRVRERKRELG